MNGGKAGFFFPCLYSSTLTALQRSPCSGVARLFTPHYRTFSQRLERAGSQSADVASTAASVRLLLSLPLLSCPGPARRGKPSTNMKLAGTRVFTGVDAYLWPLGNSCSPYGGPFLLFFHRFSSFLFVGSSTLGTRVVLRSTQFFFFIVVACVWSCSCV